MHCHPFNGRKPDLARRRAFLATLAAAAGPLTTACTRASSTPHSAPDLGYTLLDGSRSSFAALRGQVVLVNFWATQCAPCVAGMPALVALHMALRPQGLQTLAVAMQHDPPAAVAQFAESRRLPFDVLIDNTGAVAHGFGDVAVTPTSIVLDRRGRVALHVIGKLADSNLQRVLSRLLAVPAGA